MAVVGGLSNSSISRLKDTQALISSDARKVKTAYLQIQMKPHRFFPAYLKREFAQRIYISYMKVGNV